MKRRDTVKIMAIFTAIIVTLIIVIQNADTIDTFSLDDLNKNKNEAKLEASSH